jgi:hypothetical protein
MGSSDVFSSFVLPDVRFSLTNIWPSRETTKNVGRGVCADNLVTHRRKKKNNSLSIVDFSFEEYVDSVGNPRLTISRSKISVESPLNAWFCRLEIIPDH